MQNIANTVKRIASRDDVAVIFPVHEPQCPRDHDEAPSLGKRVLVMRETTERPEGVDARTAKLVGTDIETIVREVENLLDDGEAYSAMGRAHNPFGDGKSAQRICNLLAQS